MKKKIIDIFFKSYYEYWKREIKGPEPINYADEEDVIEWIKRTELHDGIIVEAQIEELEKLYEGNLKFPEYYRYFLKLKSYEEIELPLINFPSNTGVMSELIEMTERCRNTNLIPFAHSLGSFGIYCIDMDSNMKIRHWSYDDYFFNKDSSNLVASHFCSLLKIITEILDSNIEWYAEMSISREKTIHKIQSIDQDVFGGKSWISWWKDQIVK